MPHFTLDFRYTGGWFVGLHFQGCSRNSHHSKMSFPSRSAFLTLFHVFAKAQWSILVSICVQWPMVKYEVRSKPRNEYGLDPLRASQKKNLSEQRFPQTTISPLSHTRYAAFCG